jgi:hypothetical protein
VFATQDDQLGGKLWYPEDFVFDDAKAKGELRQG